MDIKDEFQDLLLVYLLLHAFLQGEIMGVQSTSANSALNGRSRQVEKKLAPFSRHCQAKLFGEIFQFYYCSKTIDPPRNLSPFSTKKERNGR
jgi:hypothetical protein